MGLHHSASKLALRSWILLWGLLLARGAEAAGEAWFHGGWAYRVPIVINPALISGTTDHAGFPVLLRLLAAQSGIFAGARADGADLVVTRGDGVTLLPREIVEWNPGTPRAEVWFRADMLSDANNHFFIYYGNPDTVVAPLETEVWGTNFLAVYHFAENPGSGVLWDYGPGVNHGLAGAGSGWTAQNAIAGAVGQGWRFNGTTNWIEGDNVSSNDSTFTVSGWFASWNQSGSSADFAFSSGPPNWNLSAKRNETNRNPDFQSARGEFVWNPNLPDTLLHQFVWCMDGVNDTVRFYFDGVEQGFKLRRVNSKPPDKVYLGLTIPPNVGIGSNLNGTWQDLMQGIIDEFRIYQGTRSPSWVLTDYNNQKQPAAFVSFGPPESRAVGVAELDPQPSPILPWAQPNPFRRSTMIHFELQEEAWVAVSIYGVDGRLVRRLGGGDMGPGAIRIPWDGRGDQGERLGEGIYFLRVEAGGRSWAGRAVLLR